MKVKYSVSDVPAHILVSSTGSPRLYEACTQRIIFPFMTQKSSARSGYCHSEQDFSCSDANKSYVTQNVVTRSSFVSIRSGFTLLEVMVALAIFATAAIALTKVGMQYTQSTSNAILRTKAQFVAMNEAALMEINNEWLTGTQSKQINSQGETWQIDKRAESTISPNVQRIEIQVSLFNAQQGKVEAGITHIVFFNYPVQAKT